MALDMDFGRKRRNFFLNDGLSCPNLGAPPGMGGCPPPPVLNRSLEERRDRLQAEAAAKDAELKELRARLENQLDFAERRAGTKAAVPGAGLWGEG